MIPPPMKEKVKRMTTRELIDEIASIIYLDYFASKHPGKAFVDIRGKDKKNLRRTGRDILNTIRICTREEPSNAK